MAEKIGLIAGNGQFPILFAQAARRAGLEIVAAAYRNEASPDLIHCVDTLEWFHLGQIGRLIKYFRRHVVTQAVMMGAIRKTRMFTNVRPDIKFISFMAGMRNTHDDAVLRGFADLIEKEGIKIQPSTMLLPELLAPAGIWTRRKPSRDENRDIQLGWHLAKEIGRLDIGQCIVMGGGAVLAVEAIEGTDAAIQRGGELGKGRAVVIKVCKPGQDTRFDVPAVGLGTIESMKAANVQALAIEAGKAVVFDRQAMVDKADDYKMAVVAFEEHQLNG